MMTVEKERVHNEARGGDGGDGDVSQLLKKLSLKDGSTADSLKRNGTDDACSEEVPVTVPAEEQERNASSPMARSRECESKEKGSPDEEQESFPDEDVPQKGNPEIVLISRGPVNSRDTSSRSHPYSPSSSLTSSSSESSQGSPLGNANEPQYNTYGGSLVSETKPDTLHWQEQFSSSPANIVKNKRCYIHQNGGCYVQLRDHSKSMTMNGHTVSQPPNSVYLHVTTETSAPVFHNASFSPLSAVSIISSASSSPTPSCSVNGDSPEVLDDNACPDLKNIADSSCASSWDDESLPDDLADFINKSCGDFKRVNEAEYQRKIAEIDGFIREEGSIGAANQQLDLEIGKNFNVVNVQNNLVCPSPVEDGPTMESGVWAPSLVPNSDGLSFQNIATKAAAMQISSQVIDANVSYEIVSDAERKDARNVVYIPNMPEKLNSENTSKCGSVVFKSLRRIAPKPPVKISQASDSPSDQSCRCKRNTTLVTKDQIRELRSSLLEKFTDEQRRQTTCIITQVPDAKITKVDEDGDTCLHVVIANFQILQSVVLIDRFAEMRYLDVRNKAGETPLFYAMHFNHLALFRYLLAKGANPNECILNTTRKLLHFIAENGETYLEFLNMLCSHPSIELEVNDNLGQTPLMVAVASQNKYIRSTVEGANEIVNSIPVIRMLLKYNASTSCVDRRDGKTIYHLAVEKKDIQLLKMLCQENKNTQQEINTQAFDGNTALHIAATLNQCPSQIELVRVLMSFNASLHSSNLAYKKPFEMVEKNSKQLKKLLMPSHHR